MTLINLAKFYMNKVNNVEEAKEVYIEALKIRRELVKI